MSGPFETEQQARELPTVRGVYEMASRGRSVPGTMAGLNLNMLLRACTDAGLKLGAYDVHILGWLSDWEPQTCAVVCGLILRASQGAPHAALTAAQAECLRDMLADAIGARTEGVSADCAGCDTDPAGLCWDHAADLGRAEAYRALAADLGVVTP
jgi:hypothetical protein